MDPDQLFSKVGIIFFFKRAMCAVLLIVKYSMPTFIWFNTGSTISLKVHQRFGHFSEQVKCLFRIQRKQSGQENLKSTTHVFFLSKSSVFIQDSKKKIWARKYENCNHVYSKQVKCLFMIQARKYEIYIHVYSEQVECFIQGSEKKNMGKKI